MLGRWRVAIKQAEEASRAGRPDEALRLIGGDDVRDHRQAVTLRARLVAALVERAGRRGDADDLAGAMHDLDLSETHGAAPDALAAARLRLAERVAAELAASLAAGDPARVREQVAALAKRKVSGPELRRLGEAADAWCLGRDEATKGEFAASRDALDRAERLAGPNAGPAVAAARVEIERRREAILPHVDRLYQAVAARRWAEVLTAADALLEHAPEHPAGRDARTKAWRQLSGGGEAPVAPAPAPGPAPRRPEPVAVAATSPNAEIRWIDDSSPAANAALTGAGMPAPPRILEQAKAPGPMGRSLLWADLVGGFLVCLDDRVVIGRASADGAADVPILGDLSRCHATLSREADRYRLHPHGPTFHNGRRVEQSTGLRDGDILRLGTAVEIRFRQPNPMSATARLELVSRHRLPMAVRGVILMADTCLIGNMPHAHVLAPEVRSPVALFRQGAGLGCRVAGDFEVDGRACHNRAALGPRSNVIGPSFSFSLEPLEARAQMG